MHTRHRSVNIYKWFQILDQGNGAGRFNDLFSTGEPTNLAK